jgi:hypothetical protein
MNKDVFFIVKCLSWLVTAGLCWLYASQGFTDHPRFDMWFWGISFWLDVIILAVSVTAVALGR